MGKTDGMSLVWFRRDLRLGDLPTLTAAAETGDPVLGLFVLDDRLLKPSGGPRKDFLFRSLEALNEQLDGRLMVVHGDPESVVPKVAKAIDADEVHISADYGPYGRERDQRVGEKVTLVETGSPYAVAPGRITKNDGEPYKVFTPYSRQWMEHGWRGPADTSAKTVTWIDPHDLKGVKRAKVPSEKETNEADSGEKAALQRRQHIGVIVDDEDGGGGARRFGHLPMLGNPAVDGGTPLLGRLGKEFFQGRAAIDVGVEGPGEGGCLGIELLVVLLERAGALDEGEGTGEGADVRHDVLSSARG